MVKRGKTKMKIFYLRNENNVPIACVASERGWDEKIGLDAGLVDILSTETINFAVSTRNPLDELSKKLGRHIATERLRLGKHVTMTKSIHVKRDIVAFIADPVNGYPLRTQDAARHWLQAHWANQVSENE
jgi:hypothetical protein